MVVFFVFLLGLCVGSLLNVVILRLRSRKSIISGRSKCPYCKTVLKWYELIPLVSFLIQKGKCRSCSKRISWQYPLVELSTGLLFVFVFNAQNSQELFFENFSFYHLLGLAYYFLLVSFLIIIFVYDLKHCLIPDKIIYPAIIAALAANYGFSSVNYGLVSALAASGFFLFLVLASGGKWMGLGDVKLAFLMGLVLGWPHIAAALFLSFASGALFGIGLIILGRKKLKSEMPFGPFLVSSLLLFLFFGSCIDPWLSIFPIR